MSLDMLEKCQLVPVRIPSLFEQNVLKAVGRTQIEGSYKVYAGKTNWRISWKLYPWSLANKKWGALETPWQMTSIRAAFTCCKACDSVGEDDFALLVSIPASCFFDQQALHDKNLKADIGGFPNWDWKISKQSLSISEHCKKNARHTKCFLQTFSRFLHVWPYWHRARFFHVPTEQICYLKGWRNANLFQWEFPACSSRMSLKHSAGQK